MRSRAQAVERPFSQAVRNFGDVSRGYSRCTRTQSSLPTCFNFPLFPGVQMPGYDRAAPTERSVAGYGKSLPPPRALGETKDYAEAIGGKEIDDMFRTAKRLAGGLIRSASSPCPMTLRPK